MVKNISIGRFFPGDSIIHRLDPRLKLYFIFMFILSIFFIKSFLVFIPLAIFLFSIIKIAKLPILMVLKGLKGIFYIVLFTTFFIFCFMHKNSEYKRKSIQYVTL